MGDVFWFLVICFFVFFLPFRLWLTNEEKRDAEDMRDHYKNSRTISDGSAKILADQKVKAEIEVKHLKAVLVELYQEIENLTDAIDIAQDMHMPMFEDIPQCKECGRDWPCQTWKALKTS